MTIQQLSRKAEQTTRELLDLLDLKIDKPWRTEGANYRNRLAVVKKKVADDKRAYQKLKQEYILLTKVIESNEADLRQLR